MLKRKFSVIQEFRFKIRRQMQTLITSLLFFLSSTSLKSFTRKINPCELTKLFSMLCFLQHCTINHSFKKLNNDSKNNESSYGFISTEKQLRPDVNLQTITSKITNYIHIKKRIDFNFSYHYKRNTQKKLWTFSFILKDTLKVKLQFDLRIYFAKREVWNFKVKPNSIKN